MTYLSIGIIWKMNDLWFGDYVGHNIEKIPSRDVAGHLGLLCRSTSKLYCCNLRRTPPPSCLVPWLGYTSLCSCLRGKCFWIGYIRLYSNKYLTQLFELKNEKHNDPTLALILYCTLWSLLLLLLFFLIYP